MGLGAKPPKPEAPKPVAPAPTVQDTQPAEEAAVKKQRRGGYQSTILTGSLAPRSTPLGGNRG
jgi:hypothetical protein